MLYSLLGLILIIIAPMWKIFKKADRPGWYALTPGLNIIEFNRINGLGLLVIMPFLSILCVLGYLFTYNIFNGVVDAFFNLIITSEWHVIMVNILLLLLIIILIIYILSILFFFPMLSLIMLILSLLTYSSIPDQYFFIIPIFIFIAVLQLATEVIYWLKMLKHLNRALWEIALLFLTLLIPIFIFVAFYQIQIQINHFWQIALGVISFFITLSIGFAYLYYLGYSVKIKYFKP